MSLLKSNPRQSALGFNPVVIRICYKPILVELKQFLNQFAYFSDEDIQVLFESLAISYFSKYADGPNRILYDLVTDNGFPVSYEEHKYAEIALAIVENIDSITRTYFPGRFGLGNMLHREIEVDDVQVIKGYQLIIRLSQNTVNQIQQELK